MSGLALVEPQDYNNMSQLCNNDVTMMLYSILDVVMSVHCVCGVCVCEGTSVYVRA